MFTSDRTQTFVIDAWNENYHPDDHRDRDRRIEIRWDDDGGERSVILTGEDVDAESVRVVAEAAAQRIGA